MTWLNGVVECGCWAITRGFRQRLDIDMDDVEAFYVGVRIGLLRWGTGE